MSHVRRTLVALAVAVLMAGGRQVAAEPLFTLAEDGRTFLYRARPGDLPAHVAEMFGIPPRDLPSFLAVNGIADATRVGPGFLYRIPNSAALALGERTAALERDHARLERTIAEERERAQASARAADEARSEVAQTETRAAKLGRLEALWPWAKAALALLLIATVAAAYAAVVAVRRQAQAKRYARTLARELDEKRKAALAERQESARRNLDLETRVRTLEAQLGPRVVISGRSS